MKKFTLTCLIVLFAGYCFLHFDKSAAVAGPNYVTLAGNSIPVGTNLLEAENKVKSKNPPDAIPLDGPEYNRHLLEVRNAVMTNNPGRLVGMPAGFSETGYPIYPATCIFWPKMAECSLSNGEVADEDYLIAHTTIIRNVDVLNPKMTCGKICVDEENRVLGYVSKEMYSWKNRNCEWLEYGNAKCN
jgi:hypothetical protein